MTQKHRVCLIRSQFIYYEVDADNLHEAGRAALAAHEEGQKPADEEFGSVGILEVTPQDGA